MNSLERSAIRNDPIFTTLSRKEQFWSEKQPLLVEHGYELRARYRPGWKPSWLQEEGGDALVMESEDSWRLPVRLGNFIDATRVSDGLLVYVKQTRTEGHELRFMAMLSEEKLRSDPKNHCIPLLDFFPDDVDPTFTYMVMPFVRRLDSPMFEDVNQFIVFVDQILEGLVFLHSVGVAHRDCSYANIMMDASTLYPTGSGFHPIYPHRLRDNSGSALHISRSKANVRYYFIDFGESSYFPPDDPNIARLVQGTKCLDHEPPEFYRNEWYDPFKLDVFLIGNLLRRYFMDKFSNLSFLAPLVERMVADDPSERLDAETALQEWSCIRGQIGLISRSWRLRNKDDAFPLRIALDTYGILKTGLANSGWF